MKTTTKVGIGGFAFNLEEDAYQELDNYLKSLEIHFQNNPEKKEIISDVEIRISELLQMRLTNDKEAVSLNDIKYIREIIGNPKDFDDDQETSSEKTAKTPLSFLKKKLYRDKDNGILGGVCSGIAQYFKIDPVIVRLIYILAFILLGLLTSKIRPFLILLYLVLWIIIPKARTLTDKLSMRGADPSIENIENREQISFTQPRNSGLVKGLKIGFGILLGIICFGLLAAVIIIIAVFSGAYIGIDNIGINEILNTLGLYSWDFKISLIAVIILPIIGIFYLCIKFLFQYRFGKGDLIITCFGFLLWIGAVFYFAGALSKFANLHKKEEIFVETVMAKTRSDTLYVKLSHRYNHSQPLFDIDNIFYLEDENKFSSFMVPRVILKKDSLLTTYKIEIENRAFDSTRRLARQRAENAKLNYSLQDSLLIVSPHIYNESNKWNREVFDLIITSPAGKTVIADDFR